MEQEPIYIEYKDKVMAYFCGKLGNITVAEDLCADVFVKAAALDRFDPQILHTSALWRMKKFLEND